ncbi:MAG: hypothetical protein ACI87W_003653 [Halieaceae bacterium]
MKNVLRNIGVLLLAANAHAVEVDGASGLNIDFGFDVVKIQCTVCHSAQLITQNRATRDGWLRMIRWMQDKQGLWPLGENEAVILDYLEANYSPTFAGRRPPLPSRLMPAC